MSNPRPSVGGAIRAALLTGEAEAKVLAARKVARDWRLGRLAFAFPDPIPDRPAWPANLQTLPPGRMPKRGKFGSERGRIALWHALAHIEFVAIDLALDMAGRFGAERGESFISDFLFVAADEAMHFALLARKLASLGSHYGRCRCTTDYGKPPRTPRTTWPRDLLWCQWFWKREGWTLPLRPLSGSRLGRYEWRENTRTNP